MKNGQHLVKFDNSLIISFLLLLSTVPIWWHGLRLRNINPDAPIHGLFYLWALVDVIIIPVLFVVEMIWIVYYIVRGDSFFNLRTREEKGFPYKRLTLHLLAIIIATAAIVVYALFADKKYIGGL